MRDALSIMDQAIACCGERLTAEVVRGLVGAVPSEVLEEMMDAVARNSARGGAATGRPVCSPRDRARRTSRGRWCASCATPWSPRWRAPTRRCCRFPPTSAPASARVAEQFSEEDLTRFLQIMLRTHGELSYKQEQRFHLELGLLKLVHAQRLLPLEQMLSERRNRRRAGARARPRGTRPRHPATRARPTTARARGPQSARTFAL